jgi:hypothetical protein
VVPDLVTLGMNLPTLPFIYKENQWEMGIQWEQVYSWTTKYSSVVITTEAIADSFAEGMEYFNTFGGNNVSCVIGKKVLEVIEEDDLQRNALILGLFASLHFHFSKASISFQG